MNDNKSTNLKYVDYKDVETLKKFINPHARIISKKYTKISTRNQRKISEAIKRARFMGFLPYVSK